MNLNLNLTRIAMRIAARETLRAPDAKIKENTDKFWETEGSPTPEEIKKIGDLFGDFKSITRGLAALAKWLDKNQPEISDDVLKSAKEVAKREVKHEKMEGKFPDYDPGPEYLKEEDVEDDDEWVWKTPKQLFNAETERATSSGGAKTELA